MTKIADCVEFHGFFTFLGYLDEYDEEDKEERLDSIMHDPDCWELSVTVECHTTGYSSDRSWTQEGREQWLIRSIKNDNTWEKLSQRTRSKFNFPVELILGDAFLEQDIEDL